MLADFTAVRRFAVPYADIDMNRHVNNVAYLRWIEQARVDYFAEVLGEQIAGARGLILRRTTIDYDRSMRYREPVAVATRVRRIGTKSFDFFHEFWSEEADTLCASATCTMVGFDYESERTIVIPDLWKSRIAAYECIAPE